MHVKTRCRPISNEHRSMVELVRRGDPPPYSRVARWANWTELGGVSWAFAWLRVRTLLIVFGMVTGGYAPAPYRGVPYDSTAPKLTWSDVRHLRIGGAITDLTNKMLIDPAVDDLLFVTVDSNGQLTTQFRPHSRSGQRASRTVGVVQPSRDTKYSRVVAAMDLIRQREPAVESIWVSAPGDS